MLPFDFSNPYDTPTPPNSMLPPRAGDFDDDISVVSRSTYAGNMLIHEHYLSYLPPLLSRERDHLYSVLTLHSSQQGRKHQLRQESVDILASQVQQAREQARKIELENERKRAELQLLKATKESRELDELLAAARQE
jgi:hypothetical protein